MELSQGTILYNRYRIERQLGQGGMGAVYLAFDTSLEIWVAVKVNTHATGESTSQFLREAHLLASLRNPNLPRVIDYFLLDQSQYLVMDYIPGDDLATLLQSGKSPSVDQVLNWARQLGTALAYLHHQNPPVIHRDIKPANIKITPEGQIVLVDFGIAKAADPSQATATGAMGYTPGFAPPEQYGGGRTGPYSDQYAFAATIYTLLTGQHPADSIQRVLSKAPLTPVGSLNPAVPAYVQQALERALSIRPEDRFATIDELVQALTDPQAAQATRPEPRPQTAAQTTVLTPPPPEATIAVERRPTPPSAPRPNNNLRKVGIGIAAVVVVCVVIGGIAAALLAGQNGLLNRLTQGAAVVATPTLPQPTPLPANTLPPPPAIPTATDPLPATATEPSPAPTETALPAPSETAQPALPSPTVAPVGGGGRIAFISNRADGKTSQIWTMQVSIGDGGQVSASDFQQVTTSEGNKTQPAWSPDGTRLLYVAPGGKIDGKEMGLDIWVMNADGTNPVDLTKRPGDDLDPAWAPDGSQIAFSNNGREDGVRQLFIMTIDGGQQLRLSVDFTEYSPTWSPDMQSLAFVISANSYPFLYLRPSNTGFMTEGPYDPNNITGRLGQVAQPRWSPDGEQIAYVQLDGGHKRIWSVRAASKGADLSRLTTGESDQDPAWSPDSKWILYSTSIAGNREIFIMTAAGTLVTQLTNDPGLDSQPAWQPVK